MPEVEVVDPCNKRDVGFFGFILYNSCVLLRDLSICEHQSMASCDMVRVSGTQFGFDPEVPLMVSCILVYVIPHLTREPQHIEE